MTVLGKALGGTVVPLAAVIADANLDTTPEMNLSYFTHEKNALSAAAGLATLSVLIEEELPKRAVFLQGLIEEALRVRLRATPIVTDFRSAGLMFAINFRRSSRNDRRTDGS